MHTFESFSNLLFNPLVDEPILQAYPKLKEIVGDEWKADENLDKILRFVILTHDPKSILVTTERDLNCRKQSACELVGIEEPLAQQVCSFENELCLYLTLRFLMRFTKSKEFAAITALENSYWENIKLLLKPISDDKDVKDTDILSAVQKKSAIKDQIDTDLKRIEAYYASFFGEDKELITKRERITPENIRKIKG